MLILMDPNIAEVTNFVASAFWVRVPQIPGLRTRLDSSFSSPHALRHGKNDRRQSSLLSSNVKTAFLLFFASEVDMNQMLWHGLTDGQAVGQSAQSGPVVGAAEGEHLIHFRDHGE